MLSSTRFKGLFGKRRRESRPTELAQSQPAPPPTPAVEVLRPSRSSAGAQLPGFQTTASDHLDRGRSDPLSPQRIRFRQAFTPAQPVVDPRMFSGRNKTLEKIIHAVEDRRAHVIIYGERGVGKTSLLHMLSLAARDARYIVVYISCGANSDFSETFRTVANEIPLLYHSAVSPITSSSEAGTCLADLLPPGKLTPRQFSDAAAKLVGTRVLVMLDEFDRAESPEFRRDIAELIKVLSDLSARVQLVIAGVAADLVDLVEHVQSIRRSISALRISAMSDEEVRTLIENGERTSGMKFQPDAVDLITLSARGSPYITNLVCHLAGMAALRAKRLQVTRADVVEALDEAIDEFRRRLPNELTTHLNGLAARLPITEHRKLSVSSKDGEWNGGETTVTAESILDEELERHLEKLGVAKGMPPERYTLILDSMKPYVQLLTARNASNVAAAGPASASRA